MNMLRSSITMRPGRNTILRALKILGILILFLILGTGYGFAQDNFFFVNDAGGVNQIDNNAGGAQSDLTRFGIDNSHIGEGFLWLQWNWDSTDLWTGNGQTGDACALFDTD